MVSGNAVTLAPGTSNTILAGAPASRAPRRGRRFGHPRRLEHGPHFVHADLEPRRNNGYALNIDSGLVFSNSGRLVATAGNITLAAGNLDASLGTLSAAGGTLTLLSPPSGYFYAPASAGTVYLSERVFRRVGKPDPGQRRHLGDQ